MATKKKTRARAIDRANIPTAVELTAASRKTRLAALVAAAEKKYGPGRVVRAVESNISYLLRRPTGITSLDIALAGGWPASAPCVLVGPEGVGKDYLLWRTMAEVQRIYKADFCTAIYFTEFRADKLFMKDQCGFEIGFSEVELKEMDMARRRAGRPGLTAAELDHYRKQTGEIMLLQGMSADSGFDELYNFMEQNLCQIIAVNSLGSLQTEAKEEVDGFGDHAQRSSEASLLSRVMPKVSMLLNAGDSQGGANETSILLLNQVRAADAGRKMPGRIQQEKDKYKAASAAHSLKHHKAIELFLHEGPRIRDKDTGQVLGRVKNWEITKGKLGTHDGLRGTYNFFFGEGIDIHGDLLATCLRLGVMELSGASYSYTQNQKFSFKARGQGPALRALRDSPELWDHLRGECFRAAEIEYRHK